jgi:EmrB/QacA subfamily drug resistance transporter
MNAPDLPTTFTPAELRRTMLGLMLALFMAALDQTIVAAALPRISSDLHGFELLAWVVAAYLVAAAVATPIYGRLGDMFGRRVMMLSAIWIFLLSSIACAMAGSMPVLVAARLFQGIGGGGLFSMTQAAVADMVSARDRARYQGYFSVTYGTASVAGPILGGVLTQYLSWHWIFWINLPLGLAALVITRNDLKRLPVPHKRSSIDYLGAILLCTGLAAGMVGFTRVGQGAGWLSQGNLLLFGLSLALLALFVLQQLRAPAPIFPLGLFRIPAIALCLTILFFSFAQLIAVSILVPLRAQMVGGLTATAAALQLVPLTLGTPIGAFTGGMYVGRTGRYKPAIMLGSCALPLALATLAFMHPGNVVLMTVALAVAGFSIGLQLPTSVVAVQHAAPREHMGVATASTSFARQLGASVVVALVTAVLMEALANSGIGGSMAGSGAEMMRELVSSAMAELPASERLRIGGLADQAFRSTLLLCACFPLVSVVLAWRLPNIVLHDQPKK